MPSETEGGNCHCVERFLADTPHSIGKCKRCGAAAAMKALGRNERSAR